MKTGGAVGYVALKHEREFFSFQDSEEHEQQRSRLRKWCRRNNSVLRHVGADRLWEVQESLSNRVGLAKALRWLYETRSNTLVITSLADLALHPARACKLLLNLRRKRVFVYELETQAALNKDTRKLRKALSSYDATLLTKIGNELRNLSRRATHASRRTRPGRKAFGTHPGEVETIKRIQDARRDKRSFRAIAEELNQEGRPARDGGKWSHKTVQKIYNRRSRKAK